MLCEGGEEDYSYNTTTTYTYTKFDDRGNWTERKCKVHSVEWECEEENVTDSREVEKRVITYYR